MDGAFIEANAARPALLRIINREAASPGPRFDYLFERYIEPVRQAGEAFLTDLHDRGLVATRSVGLVYFLMTHGAGGPDPSFPSWPSAWATRSGPTTRSPSAATPRRRWT